MPIGTTELIIVLVIVLLIFGASRVPELGRSLGAGMRNFKESVTGRDGAEDEEEPAQRAQIGPGGVGPGDEPARPSGEAVGETRR